jgi:hypothetical protein
MTSSRSDERGTRKDVCDSTPFTLNLARSHQPISLQDNNNGSKLRNAKEKGKFLIDLSPPSLNVELLNEFISPLYCWTFNFISQYDQNRRHGERKGFLENQRRGRGRGVIKCVQNSSIKLSKPQVTRLGRQWM